VYRVHDHRQTQADRVSLTDKTYKNAYTYTTHLHMQHNHFKRIAPFDFIPHGHNHVNRVLHLLVITSR